MPLLGAPRPSPKALPSWEGCWPWGPLCLSLPGPAPVPDVLVMWRGHGPPAHWPSPTTPPRGHSVLWEGCPASVAPGRPLHPIDRLSMSSLTPTHPGPEDSFRAGDFWGLAGELARCASCPLAPACIWPLGVGVSSWGGRSGLSPRPQCLCPCWAWLVPACGAWSGAGAWAGCPEGSLGSAGQGPQTALGRGGGG